MVDIVTMRCDFCNHRNDRAAHCLQECQDCNLHICRHCIEQTDVLEKNPKHRMDAEAVRSLNWTRENKPKRVSKRKAATTTATATESASPAEQHEPRAPTPRDTQLAGHGQVQYEQPPLAFPSGLAFPAGANVLPPGHAAPPGAFPPAFGQYGQALGMGGLAMPSGPMAGHHFSMPPGYPSGDPRLQAPLDFRPYHGGYPEAYTPAPMPQGFGAPGFLQYPFEQQPVGAPMYNARGYIPYQNMSSGQPIPGGGNPYSPAYGEGPLPIASPPGGQQQQQNWATGQVQRASQAAEQLAEQTRMYQQQISQRQDQSQQQPTRNVAETGAVSRPRTMTGSSSQEPQAPVHAPTTHHAAAEPYETANQPRQSQYGEYGAPPSDFRMMRRPFGFSAFARDQATRQNSYYDDPAARLARSPSVHAQRLWQDDDDDDDDNDPTGTGTGRPPPSHPTQSPQAQHHGSRGQKRGHSRASSVDSTLSAELDQPAPTAATATAPGVTETLRHELQNNPEIARARRDGGEQEALAMAGAANTLYRGGRGLHGAADAQAVADDEEIRRQQQGARLQQGILDRYLRQEDERRAAKRQKRGGRGGGSGNGDGDDARGGGFRRGGPGGGSSGSVGA
ncbi:hypothetical protein Daus18300_008854 [Diaporthe australafricana]|uniref:B box-type domain-containing protein n=1 Tax=Diaporthe australafricana TaxID=127596 RepID=A0ABR3WGG9_9PEZI